VAQSQVQAYDSEYVLGTQEEADQIKTNLRRDVARLLALKIAALQRKNP
jgi:outer membrane lipopolysaccharide assembly protein LptE/RlpB